jgi:hypothetical protein
MGHGKPDNNLESPLLYEFELFNVVFSPSYYKRQMRGSVLNSELERMWKEVGITYFEALSQHILAGTEETYEIPSQYSRSPGRGKNGTILEYEAGVPTARAG